MTFRKAVFVTTFLVTYGIIGKGVNFAVASAIMCKILAVVFELMKSFDTGIDDRKTKGWRLLCKSLLTEKSL